MAEVVGSGGLLYIGCSEYDVSLWSNRRDLSDKYEQKSMKTRFIAWT